MLEAVRTALPRPWWWDGGLALGYAVLAVVTLGVFGIRLGVGDVAWPPAVQLAAALAACVPLVWRTRRPAVALIAVIPPVAVDLVMGLSVSSAFVLADLLYCAVLHGTARTSDVVRRSAIGAWVIIAGLIVLTVRDPTAVLQGSLSTAALLLLPVMWAGEVRRPMEAAAAERAAAAQAAHIADLDRRAAVTDERTRIARDLHDSVAGHLAAISLQSQAALRADDRTRDRVLAAVRENSVRALDEMRALIEVLRGDADAIPAAAASGLAALPALVDSARAVGLTVRETSDGDRGAVDPDVLPPAVDLTAYRIVQEALTNAAAHAPGAAVDLTVSTGDDALVLDVVNDRTSADPTPGTGTGVEGMRIRAEAVGGHAEIGPTPGGERWRVRAVLPSAGARHHDGAGAVSGG